METWRQRQKTFLLGMASNIARPNAYAFAGTIGLWWITLAEWVEKSG